MKESYREALQQLEGGDYLYRDGDAIRFRIPNAGSAAWDDLVRGRVTVNNTDLYDPVLVRSDGHLRSSWRTPSMTSTTRSPTSCDRTLRYG